MEAAGGVDDDNVGAPGFAGADAVIDHGGGIAPLLMADDIDARALGPDLKLVGSGGAEGVARAEQDALALGFQ